MRAQFEATGVTYAPGVADHLIESLDAYAANWVAARRQACEATHVERTQSEALLDLRSNCLDRGRDGLAAAVAADMPCIVIPRPLSQAGNFATALHVLESARELPSRIDSLL